MKLTESQWKRIEPLIPKRAQRKDRRGRPPAKPRTLLEGVLWVLKTGARWQDLPPRYPPYQTCHQYFQSWVKLKVFEKILKALVEDLREKGKIDLAETFIDASFVKAKKGVKKSAKRSPVREVKSWQLSTMGLFLSRYPLKVLHRMRVNSLSERFGSDLRKTCLADLSETKLTILIHLTGNFDADLESNLLLPIGEIEKSQLKMDDLCAEPRDDGRSSDSFPGSSDLTA